jgi:hypothetical protein
MPTRDDPTPGHATLGGKLVVSLTDAFRSQVTPSDVFAILTTAFRLGGSFENVASGSRLDTADGSGSFRVDYRGDDVFLSNFSPAPEPSSLTLLIIGAAALVVFEGRPCWRIR